MEEMLGLGIKRRKGETKRDEMSRNKEMRINGEERRVVNRDTKGLMLKTTDDWLSRIVEFVIVFLIMLGCIFISTAFVIMHEEWWGHRS